LKYVFIFCCTRWSTITKLCAIKFSNLKKCLFLARIRWRPCWWLQGEVIQKWSKPCWSTIPMWMLWTRYISLVSFEKLYLWLLSLSSLIVLVGFVRQLNTRWWSCGHQIKTWVSFRYSGLLRQGEVSTRMICV